MTKIFPPSTLETMTLNQKHIDMLCGRQLPEQVSDVHFSRPGRYVPLEKTLAVHALSIIKHPTLSKWSIYVVSEVEAMNGNTAIVSGVSHTINTANAIPVPAGWHTAEAAVVEP